MHFFNERWAARALNMQVNNEKGPDLLDENKVVEVKFKVVYQNKYMHISWRALEYQMKYGEDNLAYWALGTYKMSRQIKDIKTTDMRDAEIFVLERKLFLVSWDWIYQFPAYRQKGKTEKSEWDNTIRFPKARLLPRTLETYQVSGGYVHLTEGVDRDNFRVNGQPMS
jgi:hypothetical protein